LGEQEGRSLRHDRAGRVLDSIVPVIVGGIRSLPQQVPGSWHGFHGRVSGGISVGADVGNGTGANINTDGMNDE
jgi:hypothetical protein